MIHPVISPYLAPIKWWHTLQRFTGRRDVLPEVIRAVAGLASDRAATRCPADLM
jgi:hypothetical protein